MISILILACASQPPASLKPAFTLGAPRAADGFLAGVDGVRGSAAGGRLHARFDPDGGVRLGDVQLRTTTFGRGDASAPVAASGVGISECGGSPCVKVELPGLTEWWIARDDGFEQGWTVAVAPAGTGDLTVDLSIPSASVSVDGANARIRTASGASWTVSNLHAWDADGVSLPSRFEATGRGLRIAVDDAGARFPVRIDPTYSTPDYALDNVGNVSVAGGGDVNGDGYVDVVMSSHESDWGWADLYLGTAEGFDETGANSTFQALYDNAHADFVPVAFAGDLNGDGFDEVIASAPAQERINIYAGAPEGLGRLPEPTWTLPEFAGHSGTTSNDPVASVAGAGDVNGDGYDDVIVGVGPYDAAGHATVYLGSSAGPVVDGSAVELHAGSSRPVDYFGYSVAGAGDVNADGYDDVIVSGWLEPAVYYGSAAGVTTVGDPLVTPGATWAVAGAGDVNGDGYDDVIVGVPQRDAGYALVFLGGFGGIDSTAAWSHEGRHQRDYNLYGYAVAGAGDVNGDGYGDIITGSEQIPDIFLGSASGLEAEPVATLRYGGSSVSGAGDVDKDGLDDVVTSGARVWLASTFLHNPDTGWDSSVDSRDDSGSGGDGCGGEKQGCASVPNAPTGLVLTLLTLGLATLRRMYAGAERQPR